MWCILLNYILDILSIIRTVLFKSSLLKQTVILFGFRTHILTCFFVGLRLEWQFSFQSNCSAHLACLCYLEAGLKPGNSLHYSYVFTAFTVLALSCFVPGPLEAVPRLCRQIREPLSLPLLFDPPSAPCLVWEEMGCCSLLLCLVQDGNKSWSSIPQCLVWRKRGTVPFNICLELRGCNYMGCILRSHSFPSPLTLEENEFSLCVFVFVLSVPTAHIGDKQQTGKNHLTQAISQIPWYLVYLLFSLLPHLLIIALCISSTGFFTVISERDRVERVDSILSRSGSFENLNII